MRKKLLVILAVLAVGILAAFPSLGAGWMYGCFTCEEHGDGGGTPDVRCHQVDSGAHGDGIACMEFCIFGGCACVVDAGSCFNIDVYP